MIEQKLGILLHLYYNVHISSIWRNKRCVSNTSIHLYI